MICKEHNQQLSSHHSFSSDSIDYSLMEQDIVKEQEEIRKQILQLHQNVKQKNHKNPSLKKQYKIKYKQLKQSLKIIQRKIQAYKNNQLSLLKKLMKEKSPIRSNITILTDRLIEQLQKITILPSITKICSNNNSQNLNADSTQEQNKYLLSQNVQILLNNKEQFLNIQKIEQIDQQKINLFFKELNLKDQTGEEYRILCSGNYENQESLQSIDEIKDISQVLKYLGQINIAQQRQMQQISDNCSMKEITGVTEHSQRAGITNSFENSIQNSRDELFTILNKQKTTDQKFFNHSLLCN